MSSRISVRGRCLATTPAPRPGGERRHRSRDSPAPDIDVADWLTGRAPQRPVSTVSASGMHIAAGCAPLKRSPKLHEMPRCLAAPAPTARWRDRRGPRRSWPLSAGPASLARPAGAVPPAGRRARHVGRSRSSHVPRCCRRGATARSAGSPLVAALILHVACPQQVALDAHVQRRHALAVDPVRHASASPPHRKRG